MVVLSKDAAAEQVALYHADCDADLEKVFLIEAEGEDADCIVLLEVNRNTPAMGLTPIVLPPHGDNPYPKIIAEITPEEFDEIGAGQLKLPEKWALGRMIFSRT